MLQAQSEFGIAHDFGLQHVAILFEPSTVPRDEDSATQGKESATGLVHVRMCLVDRASRSSRSFPRPARQIVRTSSSITGAMPRSAENAIRVGLRGRAAAVEKLGCGPTCDSGS
jgi:hypothetical protein